MYNKTLEYINQMIEDKIMPGASVFLNDQFYLLGEIDYNTKRLEHPHYLYDLASLTKVIGTTTVILQLIEQRKLSLDDKVKDYLPINNDRLTIQNLLTHTSDFQGYIENRDSLSKDELKQALLSQMNPGSHINQSVKYSDINFLYLGWIAEKILNNDIHSLIQTQVLDLLGDNTFTFKPTFNQCIPTENHLVGRVHDPKAQILMDNCGSAGLFGSITDVLLFAEMYVNNGKSKTGDQILKPKTINILNHRYTLKSEQSRSLGWVYDHGNLTHTGYTGTYLSINLITKQIFIFLSNRICPIDNNPLYLEHRDKLISIYHEEQNKDKGVVR